MIPFVPPPYSAAQITRSTYIRICKSLEFLATFILVKRDPERLEMETAEFEERVAYGEHARYSPARYGEVEPANDGRGRRVDDLVPVLANHVSTLR